MQIVWLLYIILTTPTMCDVDELYSYRQGTMETRLAEFVARDFVGDDPYAEGEASWAFRNGLCYETYDDGGCTIWVGQNTPNVHEVFVPKRYENLRVYDVYMYPSERSGYLWATTVHVAVQCDGVIPRCSALGIFDQRRTGE